MTNTHTQLAAVILSAFAAQDSLNQRVNPDWKTQGWHYYRAIWREAAEVFDHLNWMWWKNGTYQQALSPEQVRDVHVELIDILHFGLSLDIVRAEQGGLSLEARARDYAEAFLRPMTQDNGLEEAVEHLMIDALLVKEFNVKKFARACAAAGMTIDDLLAIYYGKVTLNKFRWANGYQEKTYQKMWLPAGHVGGEKEDNFFMMQLVDSALDSYRPTGGLMPAIASGDYENRLAGHLEALYTNQVTNRGTA